MFERRFPGTTINGGDPVKAPPEFFRLTQAFQFESPTDTNDVHKWIASALRYLNPNGRRVVKKFLSDLLSADPNETELQELWNSAHSGYYIVGKDGNEGVRSILTMIRDQIE